MRLIKNTGDDRVVDVLRRTLTADVRLDVATSALSLFAYGELASELANPTSARMVIPAELLELGLMGGANERPFRNRLSGRSLALRMRQWVLDTVEVRAAAKPLPQALI